MNAIVDDVIWILNDKELWCKRKRNSNSQNLLSLQFHRYLEKKKTKRDARKKMMQFKQFYQYARLPAMSVLHWVRVSKQCAFGVCEIFEILKGFLPTPRQTIILMDFIQINTQIDRKSPKH